MIITALVLASLASSTVTVRASARIVSAVRAGAAVKPIADPKAEMRTTKTIRDSATGATLRLVEFQ